MLKITEIRIMQTYTYIRKISKNVLNTVSGKQCSIKVCCVKEVHVS